MKLVNIKVPDSGAQQVAQAAKTAMGATFVAGITAGALLAFGTSKLVAWLKAKRAAVLLSKPTLFYWPARGRAEQIRLVLAEAGVEWEQPSFTITDATARDEYFADCRCKGGNLTTNVPMLYIDGRYLTQSTAVLKYAARKFGLYPADAALAYDVDNLIAAADDLRSANYKPMPMMGGGAKEKETYLAALPKHLDNFARLLGEREWFAPSGFSVADLTIYDTLDVAERQVPGTLAKYPTLKAFHARVEARPNVAAWLASEMRAKQFAFPPI